MCIFFLFSRLCKGTKKMVVFSIFPYVFFVCDAIFFLAVAKRKRAYIPCGVRALFFGYVVCLCG